MEALSQLACKTANRVSLSLIYGETTGESVNSRHMIEEALSATCHLLDQINPVELREWFEQFQVVFAESNSNLLDDPVGWSAFLGSQCDLLHEVNLHQKMIASVGDQLAIWNREEVEFTAFANSLNGLSGLVIEHSSALTNAIDDQAGREISSPRRTEVFAHAVCGLSIVLIAIDQAIKNGDPRDANCAALATFGSSLTTSNVGKLYRACQLAWQ